MDIFLSWSGDKSRKAAEHFRNWLPNVIQSINPYFSAQDIRKGTRWASELSSKLEGTQFGLIFLTKENLNAPWILFEAGALSKNIDASRVCAILLDLKPTDLFNPLAQFQLSVFEKADIFKTLESINSSAENKLSDKTLQAVFEKWWPDLEKDISKILTEEIGTSEEVRTERELIEEALRLLRRFSYSSFETENKLFNKLAYKPVTYDEKTKTIKVWLHEQHPYEVSLDRLNSGAELIDFVLQINAKGVCTPEHIKAFLDCVEQLTDRYFQKNAQGIFCPFGENKEVKWPNN
jgi:TIR domain